MVVKVGFNFMHLANTPTRANFIRFHSVHLNIYKIKSTNVPKILSGYFCFGGILSGYHQLRTSCESLSMDWNQNIFDPTSR